MRVRVSVFGDCIFSTFCPSRIYLFGILSFEIYCFGILFSRFYFFEISSFEISFSNFFRSKFLLSRFGQ
jgi:hypothetical protein